MRPEDFGSLGFLKFRIARALGGGIDTMRKLGELRLSEIGEFAKYADYLEAVDESRAIKVVDHGRWERWELWDYMRDLRERLGVERDNEEKEKKDALERECQILNLRIMMGK